MFFYYLLQNSAQGIPNLPDLTQPKQLIDLGQAIWQNTGKFGLLILLMGGGIGLINFSLKWGGNSLSDRLDEWFNQFHQILRIFFHFILILLLVIMGFFLCGTLSARYHFWEQARIEKIAKSVSGERLEQRAPQVRYLVKEPYTYDTQVDGKIVRVKSTQEITRYLNLAGSQINVKLDQTIDPSTEKAIYQVEFTADYQVINQLEETDSFIFEIPQPWGYKLLQNFQVEQDGKRLTPVNPGTYDFPFTLEPGGETRFKVTYKTQGGARWVYNPEGQLLSNFRLTTFANFPNADFASGIIPTESKVEGKGTRFTWVFQDNVSVLNPFGVFTSLGKIHPTGIIPRLLILAPILLLWWLGLLYFSISLNLKDILILGGLFFAYLLSLTYLSRSLDMILAWSIVSLILLILVGGLGTTKRAKLAVEIATLAGGILPVLGLLIPTSGITLSLAGFLSILWLVIRHWYRLF